MADECAKSSNRGSALPYKRLAQNHSTLHESHHVEQPAVDRRCACQDHEPGRSAGRRRLPPRQSYRQWPKALGLCRSNTVEAVLGDVIIKHTSKSPKPLTVHVSRGLSTDRHPQGMAMFPTDDSCTRPAQWGSGRLTRIYPPQLTRQRWVTYAQQSDNARWPGANHPTQMLLRYRKAHRTPTEFTLQFIFFFLLPQIVKKLFLSLAAACAITTAFAQNQATLDQSGTSQQATIKQAGQNQALVTQNNGTGTGGNNLTSSQTGSYNYLQSTQSGTTNSADYKQNLQGSSYAISTQTGTSNKITSEQASVTRSSAAAYFTQTGTSNEATLSQVDNVDGQGGTVATFKQTGNKNVASIKQGDAKTGDANTATITQNGDSNTAKLEQVGVLNNATFSQVGNSNVIKGLSGDVALQSGTSNSLMISQTSNFNTASVGQTGAGNMGTITQGNQ